MNKGELIKAVSSKSDLNQRETAEVIDNVMDLIEETLAEGKKVQLVGFGTFEVRERSARKGRNPQTGKEIEIPASKVPAFKAGKAFKDAVNGR